MIQSVKPTAAIFAGKRRLDHPTPARHGHRRRESPTYTRDPDTGRRVPVWEFTPCGEPLSWPEVIGFAPPPCFVLEPEDDDESRPYHPAEV